MRITQQAKAENRIKILNMSQKLFNRLGYEKTTTRDISEACGMAKGTLFNYFKSKETLAMTMVADAMETGQKQYKSRKSGDENFEEELFLLIASELRALRPFRHYIGPVLESGMSVFSKISSCEAGDKARKSHLETVLKILLTHGFESAEDSIIITMYWSLYLGILAHWSRDNSDRQSETLTLVDYAMHMFTSTVVGEIQLYRQATCSE